MIRTKYPYPGVYFPLGGHMPFPPNDCTCIQNSFIQTSSGIRWIDNGFCASKCKKICDRRKQYKANNNAEWFKEAERLDQQRAAARGLI